MHSIIEGLMWVDFEQKICEMMHFFYYRGTDASALSFNLLLLSLQFQIHFNLQKLWTKIVFSSLFMRSVIFTIFLQHFHNKF